MPKFLFWNMGQKPMLPVLKAVAEENDVDILILAESPNTPGEVLITINADVSAYHYALGQCSRISIFTRFDGSYLIPLEESDRYSIRKLAMPARQEVILVGVHLPSQLHFVESDIGEECRILAKVIRDIEAEQGHSRTLLLGDLNLNPFDEGIATANGLHAVMSRRVALRGDRIIQGNHYPFFYNPMWAHFGDRTSDVAGTYFYQKAKHKMYFWNIFDQVLLRPGLVGNFSHDQVRILTVAGTQSLVDDNGCPNRTLGSDHLPVLLDLDF
jgi:exonuclease III